MKKRYITVVLGVLFLCSVIIVGMKSNRVEENINLENVIINNIKESNSINFADITDFEWDNIYVFTPYSNPKDIFNKDKISTGNFDSRIEFLDTIFMIGFVKDNKLVSFVEIPIEYIEKNAVGNIKFSKEESEFNISKEKSAIIF